MKTSLDHLPEHKQQDVQTIATILRDEFDKYLQTKVGNKASGRIVKIILFGSHAKGTWVYDPANGYISDYDILLIVNNASLVEEYELWHSAEDRIRRSISTPMGLIIHSIEDVNNQLNQGHYFFKDIREQGIELYSKNGKALALPGNLTSEEQKEIAEKHFEQWIVSANQFFVTYHDDIKRKWYSKAAFELHQAAERYYACTLLVCTNYRPKTHNIEHLRSLCALLDQRYIETFPGNTKFNRRSFQRLKHAYIDARYSEHYEIAEEELNWLAEEVERLQGLTEEVCRVMIRSFGG
jgi:HEPN domain-containing protein/predicted nucleotidyltransferase